MMLRTIIVEDEPLARKTLTHLLEEYCESVELIGTANDVLTGVKAINNLKPDLVFLDVRMPNYSGFKLIEYFEEIDFQIVFTTAYEEYAMPAYKVNAVGYLLKPINIDELIKVVEKVEQNLFKNENEEEEIMVKNAQINPKMGTIIIPTKGGILNLKLKEILYVQAEGKNTRFHLTDNSTISANLKLKECMNLLASNLFLRIHKSIIINFVHVVHYGKGRESHVNLSDGSKLDVSRNYKDELTDILALFPR